MISILYIVMILLLLITDFGQSLNLLTRLFECGPNEKYTFGSICIETCTFKPKICPAMIKFGCFCMDGYLRQSNATGSPCIKREECKNSSNIPICGVNEEYTTCGSACASTCDDLRYPLPKPLKPCILSCRSGCFCKQGYYRAHDGKCVPPDQCCNENEKYQTCGSACIETCNQKPQICTLQCVAGCFCACSDYVREDNSTDSACIHRDKCPTA
ncbi:unnamed protein product [Rotaria sordida]|uniref:TIL domain-containing protein n=1 Tax=Rotaria sordida TaxID=392033 RepID=A0A814ZQI8_9BILA|nr:unnamed protein product [Rotaria sordida]CAF3852299.1 unnamed protein product [Rotaria sordida]